MILLRNVRCIAPFQLILADILPPFMCLANFVDLIGSLVTTLEEAISTPESQYAI